MSQLIPFESEDFLETAREDVTEQFKEKPIIDRYVQLITTESENIQKVLKDLMQNRSIDTAQGAQLDIIGDIVGQPRDLFNSVLNFFFGFSGAEGALSYGTTGSNIIGGRYKDLNEELLGSRYLNDTEYAALIKIKILKNSTTGVIDEFIEIVKLLYAVEEVTYTESSAKITINIGRDFNDPELSYFKGLAEIQLGNRYLPLPLGVEIEYDGAII